MSPYDLLWLLLPVAAFFGWRAGRRRTAEEAPKASANGLRSDYFKGINYLLNEQPDKAIEVFIKVLEVDSETVETHLALGNLYRRRGEVDRAIRIHQNIIARPALSEEQRTEALLELGQDYMKAGLLDRAENLFEELSEHQRYQVQALRQLIDIYEQEKDWDKAIASAGRLERITGSELGPVIAHYYCEKAQRQHQGGEWENALDLVALALSTHPDCVRASLLEGTILSGRGRHAAAIAAFRRVESQDKDYLPETVQPMEESYRALSREDEMGEYLVELQERYGWTTATLALAERERERSGLKSAIDFMSGQLRNRVSVRGLDQLLQLELEAAESAEHQHLSILKEVTQELIKERPIYQCQHCGFPGKLLHWQCPSCKHWSSIKPIFGVQGE